MKIRNIPFGYCYKEGQVEVDKEESKTLIEIFKNYLDGMSLLKISQELNNKKIEYMTNIISWNKSRIKKIIDDERYLGNETYPRIIDKETYDRLQKIKQSKNTQKTINRKSEIFKLNVPIICSNCNSHMHRRRDNRCNQMYRWTCENKECKTIIQIEDEELLQKVTNILNMIIDNPDIIDTTNKSNNNNYNNENTITNKDEAYLPKEEMQKKIISSISEIYSKIDTYPYISRRIKYEFEKSEKIKEFQLELFNNTVKLIKLYENKEIGLTLVNNQYVDMG